MTEKTIIVGELDGAYKRDCLVFSGEGLSPCLRVGGSGVFILEEGDMNIPVVVDKNDSEGNFCSSEEAKVFINKEPVARTLRCNCGNGQGVHHNNMVLVVREVGRNPDNPTSRKKGLPLEQRLEIKEKEGLVGTLTTVQKDNMLLECDFYKQAIETAVKGNAEEDDVVDAFNGVVHKDGLSPTITTRPEEKKTAILPCVKGSRIRKLTPKECWRLMGYTDEDFDNAKNAGVSNSQLYKQAGNAIVKQVLMAIFKQML